MQIAIVGLAGAGKTTVFNTLTRGHAETGGYGGLQLNVGVVKVPDERLDRLAEVFKPKKIVHADVTYVDLPGAAGLDRGPGRDRGAARRAPRAAARLRRADPRRPRLGRRGAPAPGRDRWTPARDLEQLDLEFMLADLAMVDRRLERLRRRRPPRHAGRARGERARGGDPRAPQARARGRAADPRRAARRGRGEGDPRLPVPDPEAGPRAAQRRRGRPRRGAGPGRADRGGLRRTSHAMVDALSAQDRDGAGRARARRGGGVHGGARPRRVEPRPRDRAVLPAGRPDLVPHRRARTRSAPGRSPTGRRAVDAAGAIHTDLAKGFIRAETIGVRGPARRWARSPRRRRSARSAPRARPTGSATATSSRSCSAASLGARATLSFRRLSPASRSARIEA